MGQIFVVTFPFFALVLCGYLATSRRMLPMEAIPGLNVFVLFFALPCMLYRFASITPIVRLLDASVSVTYLLCALVMVALTVALARGAHIAWNDAAFGALVGSFPNSGFMGVPLLVALLGPQAAGPAIVALAADMVFTSSLCIALSQLGAAGEQGARRAVLQALKGMLTNPLPWAIALGCLSAATGWRLPAAAQRTVEMLAEAASPAALFTLGAVLARSRLRGFAAAPVQVQPQRRDVLQLVVCKVIVHPAAVFAAGSAAIALGAPLEPFSLMVLVLTAALPSASNVPILAERFGADAGRIARVVLITTAVAFATFPLVVLLLR
jgi:malonate transporter and related proteins